MRPHTAHLLLAVLSLCALLLPACGEEAAQSVPPLISTRTLDPGTRCPAGGQQLSVGLDQNGDGDLQDEEITSTQVTCNGEAGATGPDGLNTVSRSRTQAPSATCPSGGRVLETGLDANENDALDDEEVLNTNLLCNGNAGPATLIRFTPEPSGVNCSNGGERLEYGVDASSDGVLDAEEVLNTQYVCNGGELAARVTHIDQGSDPCPNGGVRVETGLDTNDNGTLEDAEVSLTQVACNRYITQVEAGLAHTCAMWDDGELSCWGSNALLQLGLAEEETFPDAIISRPRPFTKLADVAQFGLGFGHTCATTAPDDALWCWGSNSNGQLGQDTTGSFPLGLVPDPLPVLAGGEPLTGVSSFSLGQFHTCAIAGDDDAVWCWGSDSSGQLGSNRGGGVDLTIQSTVPAPALLDDGSGAAPAPLTNVRQVAAGDIHTCAVTNDSRVVCWGGNDTNQLASATAGAMRATAADTGLTNVRAIAAGDKHTCALRDDGSVWCWGRNNDGQLGISTATTTSASPVQVRDAAGQPLTGAVAVAAGERTACAALTSGALYCWGTNNNGQLAASPATARADFALPVSALDRVTDVTLGGDHGCAIRDGQLYCWGLNNDGQLGVGSTADSRHPIRVF